MKKLFKNKQLWGGLIAIFLLWFCLKSVTLTDIWGRTKTISW